MGNKIDKIGYINNINSKRVRRTVLNGGTENTRLRDEHKSQEFYTELEQQLKSENRMFYLYDFNYDNEEQIHEVFANMKEEGILKHNRFTLDQPSDTAMNKILKISLEN